MDKAEALLKVAVFGKVIYRIKTAHNSSHSAVKLKFAHILAQQKNALPRTPFPRYLQHFGRCVDAGHVESTVCKLGSEPPGAAGKIKHKLRLGASGREPLKTSRNEISPCAVVNIRVHRVIDRRGANISPAHSCSPIMG